MGGQDDGRCILVPDDPHPARSQREREPALTPTLSREERERGLASVGLPDTGWAGELAGGGVASITVAP
jgi:hypothetical protein